ncbi:trypsin alpha-3-like [Anastrepha obliqua]|uniref:trypsin alpha-3-like n=1 Tax=Anastrepha obliqua TaxID=95512 RepID=UPI00240A072E|nr:trypsin alpha-3-like [Anastrepha obliqua]
MFAHIACRALPLLIAVYTTVSHADGFIGGTQTKIQNYPAVASLETSNGTVVCGGALVSTSVVVSAAQCLEYNDPADLYVRLGTSDYASGGERISIASYKIHEDFDCDTMANDLVVIKLAKSIKKTKTVRTIKMPKKEPKAGKIGALVGWNANEQLAEAEAKIISTKECGSGQYAYSSDDLTASMLCAAPVDAEVCDAQPGTPLIIKRNLVGVVSWGYGCCGDKGHPVIYTEISKLRKWIKNTAKKLKN